MTVRNRFERQLESLHLDIIKMGAMIERAIEDAFRALTTGNEELSRSVIESESAVDDMAGRVEAQALSLLLRQHPVAGDLRAITTALKIVGDMERISDQARDISEINLYLMKQDYKPKWEKIPKMADLTKRMVNMSVDAYVTQNQSLADEVIELDDKVDEQFELMKADMIVLLQNNSEHADAAIYLMMIAKYFEKIGDHAENIAEWVQFSLTGVRKHKRLL